jgi:hypothetical protein
MSETVHYKGTLKKLERKEGVSLEEQCKEMLGGGELPSYFDNYQEWLEDNFYREIIIRDGYLYRVEKMDIDPDGDIFNASIGNNEEIEFEVRYYNGGCSFNEAIEHAIKNIK